MSSDAARLIDLVDDPAARCGLPAVELARAFLDAGTASTLNAVVTATPERALAAARRVDHARAAGRRLPLDGLPMLVKDNIDVSGVPTTLSGPLAATREPVHSAVVVDVLERLGAIVLGKAALHELAFGVTCANEDRGPTRNPWDTSRIPGGSSGGSAAAVAADLAIAALGTDTGGSVRIPAALTGVTGLRPTTGSVSTAGVHPVSWTFDCVGPIARSAADVAALWDGMRGLPSRLRPRATPAGLRVAVLDDPVAWDVEHDVAAAVRDVVSALTAAGAMPRTVRGLDTASATAACSVLIHAQAAVVNAPLLDIGAVSPSVRSRLRIGTLTTSADVEAAVAAQWAWASAVARALDQVDVLVLPTTEVTAPKIGTPDEMITTTGRLTRLTYPWSFAGVPALSLPCGHDRHGLPIGAQLVAASGREDVLLDVAAWYQSVTDHHRRRPPRAGSTSPKEHP